MRYINSRTIRRILTQHDMHILSYYGKCSLSEQPGYKAQGHSHTKPKFDRVRFRVCVQVFRCLHKMAPEYLSTYCQPVSGISGRRHLRSADRGHLDFPRVRLASYRGRSFAYAGPSNWNSLPASLETVVFLFYLLSTTSKPFSSLSTRLAHASAFGVLLQ